jgi:hypothetical protein
MITVTWKPRVGYGADCYLGPYRVACTERRTAKSDKEWRGVSYLPGIAIREDLNHFTSDADARTIVELVVQKWFDRVEPATHAPTKSED